MGRKHKAKPTKPVRMTIETAELIDKVAPLLNKSSQEYIDDVMLPAIRRDLATGKDNIDKIVKGLGTQRKPE